MRSFWTVALAVAGSLVTVAAPAGVASADSGGFVVTRVFVGGRVMSVASDPAAGVVYGADSLAQGSKIAAIDAATGTVVATISVPMFPRDVAVNSATGTVYTVGDSPAKIAVIDGATDAVTATVSLPQNAFPDAVAVNPGTHMLYVGDDANEVVDVFNTSNNKLVGTISLNDPQHEPNPRISAITVDTATNKIYLSDTSNSLVTVIGGATNTVTHRIALPHGAAPRSIAVGVGTVYVADEGTAAISVISTATDTVSATITGLGTIVTGVALGPAGTLYAVAPDGGPFGMGITYVIDTAGGKVTAQIPRGGEWVVVDSASAYISNGFATLADSVSVVTPSSATTMCPVLLAPNEVIFTRGQARQVQLEASAIPSASFSATGLPAGLTLSPAGLLSGTPAAGTGGFYQATVTVANGISPPDTEGLDISVYLAPEITSAAHATFRTGVAGAFRVTATGSPAPTFSETGRLPRGVTLHGGGLLAGVPAKGTGGRYQLTVTADNGSATSAKQAFTLTVDQAPAFASPEHVTFRAGKRKTFTIVTRGFPAARLAESGKLPAGITFLTRHADTATLSGKASRRARGRTFRITITARNGVAPAAHQVLTIVIR